MVLFEEYRRGPIRAKELRDKIEKGELPKLPTSKYFPCSRFPNWDGQMCPAWHIREMCNPGCPRSPDHEKYTVEEYTPLVEWCQNNYPS